MGCSVSPRNFEEFRISNFGLRHPKSELFLRSQWSSIPPVLYLIYQWALTSYLLAVKIYSGIITHHGMKHLIYLTNWTYTLLTMSFLLRSIVSTISHVTRSKTSSGEITEQRATPWYLSVVWVFYNIASTASLVVSIVFWSAVYHGEGISFNNFNAHAVNSMIVLLDLGITAMPVRLFHLYLPVLYGTAFGIFSVIYWAIGGTDPFGHRYIYSVLDYGKHTETAVLFNLAIAILGLPLCHGVIFALHKLRVHVFDRLNPPELQPKGIQVKTELSDFKSREYA